MKWISPHRRCALILIKRYALIHLLIFNSLHPSLSPHFVMLSLSQYLNEILKQVQNDSVRQNGAEFTLTRIPTTHFVRREFYPLPQGERVFCSNPFNPSTIQLPSLFLPLTLTLSHTAYSLTRLILRLFELASHKGRGNLFFVTHLTSYRLIILTSLFKVNRWIGDEVNKFFSALRANFN